MAFLWPSAPKNRTSSMCIFLSGTLRYKIDLKELNMRCGRFPRPEACVFREGHRIPSHSYRWRGLGTISRSCLQRHNSINAPAMPSQRRPTKPPQEWSLLGTARLRRCVILCEYQRKHVSPRKRIRPQSNGMETPRIGGSRFTQREKATGADPEMKHRIRIAGGRWD